MKDNPEFNIRFVSLIETKPCIYDHTRSDYSNRNKQDLAWEQIAKELQATVADCKERWKNLRGSYTRHLKYSHVPSGSAAKRKRPYYLAEYMAFLLPFTKSRNMKSSVAALLPSQTDNATDFDDADSGSDNEGAVRDFQSEVGLESTSPLHSPSTSHQSTNEASQISSYDVHDTPSTQEKKIRRRSNPPTASLEDVNKSAMQYFQCKQAFVEKGLNKERQYEDPDISFLMSVVPDMKKMDDSQKRRFKVMILSTADKILTENRHESSSSSMNREPSQLVQMSPFAQEVHIHTFPLNSGEQPPNFNHTSNPHESRVRFSEGTLTELQNVPGGTVLSEFLNFQNK